MVSPYKRDFNANATSMQKMRQHSAYMVPTWPNMDEFRPETRLKKKIKLKKKTMSFKKQFFFKAHFVFFRAHSFFFRARLLFF